MLPGVLKFGSVSWRFERCFQLLLNGTLVVTYRRTAVSFAMTLPQRVVGDTLKLTTPICLWQYWCRMWRCCARHSITKDVDDAKSNNALPMVVEPSEAITKTWEVRRSLDYDVWDVTLWGVFSNRNRDTLVCLWGLASLSRWSQVSWGL